MIFFNSVDVAIVQAQRWGTPSSIFSPDRSAASSAASSGTVPW
jgi:hypothetical protein